MPATTGAAASRSSTRARMSWVRMPPMAVLRALSPATIGGWSATVSVSTDCAAAREYSGTSTAAAIAIVDSTTTTVDRPKRDRMPRSVTIRPDTGSPPGNVTRDVPPKVA
jgi:hypothetical protein